MLVGDLRYATGLMSCIGIALCASVLWTIQGEMPSLESRTKINWSPGMNDMIEQPSALSRTVVVADAITRPLFRMSRRPFDPSKVATPPAPPNIQPELPQPIATPLAPVIETPQFGLKGVAITGGRKLALLTLPETPDGLWLAEGEEMNGWRIAEIEAGGVSLTSAAATLSLKLYVDNGPIQLGNP
jgi:hypothetical protein